MQRYKVTCNKCKAVREVGIVRGAMNEIIDWLDNLPDPQIVKIISGRKRLDDQWGWQCICGNNDLMSRQEIASIKNRAAPQPQEIAQVVKNLKPQIPKFIMTPVGE